jgi:hypothetical protein
VIKRYRDYDTGKIEEYEMPSEEEAHKLHQSTITQDILPRTTLEALEAKLQAVIDKSEDTCYTKAKIRGEKTFTLRGQDIFAPKIICEWIKEGMLGGIPDDKLREAFECALTMRNTGLRKVPD